MLPLQPSAPLVLPVRSPAQAAAHLTAALVLVLVLVQGRVLVQVQAQALALAQGPARVLTQLQAAVQV